MTIEIVLVCLTYNEQLVLSLCCRTARREPSPSDPFSPSLNAGSVTTPGTGALASLNNLSKQGTLQHYHCYDTQSHGNPPSDSFSRVLIVPQTLISEERELKLERGLATLAARRLTGDPTPNNPRAWAALSLSAFDDVLIRHCTASARSPALPLM